MLPSGSFAVLSFFFLLPDAAPPLSTQPFHHFLGIFSLWQCMII
uniref:Uncharacterized protein n=1 Tax=Setaria viridis TaxID=4556 RepID=A0A4U6WRB4_SETVI|nr:hypothetical protein SEVIR_1G324166v2 [Setaria viridis]